MLPHTFGSTRRLFSQIHQGSCNAGIVCDEISIAPSQSKETANLLLGNGDGESLNALQFASLRLYHSIAHNVALVKTLGHSEVAL